MRKIVYAIISFLAIPFLFSACLNDENTTIEYGSDALVTAFSINDIETKVPSKTASGKDTTLIITMSDSVNFIINQNENRIYNNDSLPVGTDITKVSVNFSIIGYAVTYTKNQKDTLWTSADSLDFTNPVQFKVYAYDGTTRSYTAQINVHRQEPDSLVWNQLQGTNFNIGNNMLQKAVFFQNNIYVFAANDNQVLVTYTNMTDGHRWHAPEAINIDGADYTSVIAFKNQLYLLAQNKLYTSTDGISWKAVETDRTFTQLFATSSTHLYGISNKKIVQSEDGINWPSAEKNIELQDATDYFPSQNVTYLAKPLSTNSEIERLMVIGTRETASDTTAVVWTKLSNEKEWSRYKQSLDNGYGCPKLHHLAVIHYDNHIYAFGGKKDFQTGRPVKAFDTLYRSTDNGITWKPTTRMVKLDKSFMERTESFSYTLDSDNYIWIMWSNSKQVWKGKINRLGFETLE